MVEILLFAMSWRPDEISMLAQVKKRLSFRVRGRHASSRQIFGKGGARTLLVYNLVL
jgi:hypothetical protein